MNSNCTSSNSLANSLLLMQKAAAGLNQQNGNQLNQHIQQQQQQQQSATCNLNNTLFVGNLHASLQEIDLIQVFRPFGNIVECCKKWLHFGFVKFITEEEACHAYVTLNGFRLKGRPMRLEFQNRTKKARIKAIIAQATLQANGIGNNDGGFNLNSFQLNDERQAYSHHHQQQHSHHQQPYHQQLQQQQQQLNSLKNSFMYQSSLLECLNKKLENTIDASIANSFGQSTTTNLFNTDQLIKFASQIELDQQQQFSNKSKMQIPQFEFNFDFSDSSIDCGSKDKSKNDDMLLSLVKKTISPIDSPQHDLSSSSDSGCRSASFLADCDDSAIVSTVTTVTSSTNKGSHCGQKSSDQYLTVDGKQSIQRFNDDISLSEHLEFTCSNTNNDDEEKLSRSAALDNNKPQLICDDENDNYCDQDDCDSDCDTSDDASELPLDSDCLNDLDLIEFSDLNSYDYSDLNRYNQVVEKDGSVARKKLKYGCIYRSINQTMSLFIESSDILKQMDEDEYDEYVLFPNEDLDSINSYSFIDENLMLNVSNTELVESLQLVIKNHFYL